MKGEDTCRYDIRPATTLRASESCPCTKIPQQHPETDRPENIHFFFFFFGLWCRSRNRGMYSRQEKLPSKSAHRKSTDEHRRKQRNSTFLGTGGLNKDIQRLGMTIHADLTQRPSYDNCMINSSPNCVRKKLGNERWPPAVGEECGCWGRGGEARSSSSERSEGAKVRHGHGCCCQSFTPSLTRQNPFFSLPSISDCISDSIDGGSSLLPWLSDFSTTNRVHLVTLSVLSRRV